MFPEVDAFRQVVYRIFRSWTALRLAVEHGCGGRESSAKADWLADATVWLFTGEPGNDAVYADEVEKFLATNIEEQFPELLIDDGSVEEVSRKLVMFSSLLRMGDVNGFQRELNRLPSQANLSGCIAAPTEPSIVVDPDSLGESLEEMSVEEESAHSRPPVSSPTREPRAPRPEPDEDGFVLVTRSKR